MKTAATVLTVIGVICLVSLLTPMHRTLPFEEKSEGKITQGKDERFSLGLPQSPWFLRTSVSRKIEIKNERESSFSMNFSHSTKIEFVSWSFALFVMGIAFLVLGRRLGKSGKTVASGSAEGIDESP